MGVGCYLKMNTPKPAVLVVKTRDEQAKENVDLKLYYKANKKFMHQKVRPIFKEIYKFGKHDSDTINLNFVNFQQSKIEFLTCLMPSLKHIKVLRLWKSCIGNEGMKKFSKDLGTLSNLEVLSLEDNSLGADGCMYLTIALEKLTLIRELWLHINDIGSVGASCLASVIGELKDLESLGLDENLLENDGALKLISVVKNLQKVKMLGLGYNMISECACLNIAVMLAQLPLEKLILSGNNISEGSHSRFITLLPRTQIIF